MEFTQLIKQITPDIHQRLKTAVELGKWPDGRVLTQEQREISMQAVITYENQYLNETERVGYIDKGHKSTGDMCDSKAPKGEESKKAAPLKWL